MSDSTVNCPRGAGKGMEGSFTGSATVVGTHGFLQGGSGASNYFVTSGVAGATTLIGAGKQDILIGVGRGNVTFNRLRVHAFGSGHGDISGFVMADGSVQFLKLDGSDTDSLTLFRRLTNPADGQVVTLP
jgi:hypothetical protein